MRIHTLINSTSLNEGGAERLANRIHLSLIEMGYESHLIGLLAERVKPDKQAKSATANTVCFNLTSPYSLSAFLKTFSYLRKQVKKNDIVHAQLFPTLFYCALAKVVLRSKFKLITTEHNTHNNRRGTLIGKLIDSIIYRQTEKILCISEGASNSLNQWMPFTQFKTTTIYNGIPLSFESYQNRPNCEKIQLLSLGRLTQQKNYLTTLKALAWLRKHPDFNEIFERIHYTIAGNGSLRSEIESSISELELSENVTLLGHVSEVKPLIEAADIFLIASNWEGFGLAAVEAMNGSLPVIASDVDGLREIISGPPDCGLLVDPQSAASIGEAIARLAKDTELRSQLARIAFIRSQNFNETEMISSYVQVYQSLVDSPAS